MAFFRVADRCTSIGLPMVGLMLCCRLFNGAYYAEAENLARQRTIPTSSTASVNIMPLGDSITASSQRQNSYRFYLWHLALSNGYRINFVGSEYGVSGGPPASADFDMDHEGHPGWRADEILAQIKRWASLALPDFVLIHVGHNDLCQGQSVESTVLNVRGIIDELRTVNPHVTILLAQLTASAGQCHSNIPAFNAQLPAIVMERTRSDSRIVLVDQHAGFDPAIMTYDGFHPNALGEAQMADRWFAKLAPLLDDFLSQSTRSREAVSEMR